MDAKVVGQLLKGPVGTSVRVKGQKREGGALNTYEVTLKRVLPSYGSADYEGAQFSLLCSYKSTNTDAEGVVSRLGGLCARLAPESVPEESGGRLASLSRARSLSHILKSLDAG